MQDQDNSTDPATTLQATSDNGQAKLSLIVGGLIDDIGGLPSAMDDVRKRLGRNVARLRHQAGMSQEAFADHAGLHRTYISDIERGVRNPTATVIVKLASALGVSAGDLLD